MYEVSLLGVNGLTFFFFWMFFSQWLVYVTDRSSTLFQGKPDVDASEIQIDGRYNHTFQVQERLNFLRYIVTMGKAV